MQGDILRRSHSQRPGFYGPGFRNGPGRPPIRGCYLLNPEKTGRTAAEKLVNMINPQHIEKQWNM